MKRILWVILGVSFAFTMDDRTIRVVPGSIQLAAPVRNDVSISGSFGELRHNHFHAGIDVRSSRGVDGDDILAVADGYISKIIIDAEDLGKTLYISHPQGLVSVYAHLNKFRPDLENIIRQEQINQKQFQVEITFSPGEFPVEQGEFVAYMGNTGASRGKHLHFELRDARGEEVWDPLLFGFPIEDNRRPQIRRVKVTGYDREGHEVYQKIFPRSVLERTTIPFHVPGESFSISVDAMDYTDQSHFVTGIKSLQMDVDGEMHYQFIADKWKRSDTKYINAHIDHGGGKHGRGKFHRCYLLRGNCLGLYDAKACRGFIPMVDSTPHDVKLEVADGSGNSSLLEFKLRKANYIPKLRKSIYKDTIFYDREKNLSGAYASFSFREGSVYEDFHCEVKETPHLHKYAFSGFAGLAPYNGLLHFPLGVRLKPNKKVPEELKSKCVVALKMGKGFMNVGGVWDGEFLKANARSLGPFTIMLDTVAPKLSVLAPKKKSHKWTALKFRISDNFTTSKEMPDLAYEAYIDDQWVIMEYDKKSALLIHRFEPWLSKGKHRYKVLVRDQVGNERVYNGSFVL
ncbi:MAG: M23 family metallopeptidase [Saprospiraceae bacterium]|nr:M23 family metallopeptidase [Saprospiraceae bacterium]